MDSKTKFLLHEYMDDEEDSVLDMETPLAAMYSNIKEKRKLGLKQMIEGKEKSDYGLTSPKSTLR